MMGSDSPFQGAVLDPAKCSKLSMEERREIVYELANWSHGAPEMLQTWSRQDILQILCSEMGKERKYTGLTKLKIIEHLLKVVSGKKSLSNKSTTGGFERQSSSTSVIHKALKRPRKSDNPTHLPIPITDLSAMSNDDDLDTATYCKNAACKARLMSKEDPFCKRCSCCICHKYDENKDPSLWLTCSSEPPFLEDSCNVSCHLECALKHERSGIARNGLVAQLDGSFYCVSCGKMNDLMRCWRKQMMIAKETRRVDILCYRLSLSQKLLAGSKKYREISEIVDDATKKLEAEVGTLAGISAKTVGRGIVNRLSVGQEVQRLCASAVVSFDSMVCCTPLDHESKMIAPPNVIKIEEISPTSIAVILGPDSSSESNVAYTLWHHKADEKEKAEPTCTLVCPKTRFTVSSLSPETEYVLRVVAIINTHELSSSEVRVITTSISTDTVAHCPERSQSPQTNCSTLSNPSSVEDETNNVAPCSDSNPSMDPSAAPKSGIKDPLNAQICEAMSTENGPKDQGKNEPITSLPITPSRVESLKDGSAKKGGSKSQNKDQVSLEKLEKELGKKSSSKKRRLEIQEEKCDDGDGPSRGSLEYYIKVIRCLECEGHIDKSFRQKFLTWYGIRATPEETRVVKAFVDALIDDHASLAEQLLDTFEDIVSSKRSSATVPPGFCLKLWH